MGDGGADTRGNENPIISCERLKNNSAGKEDQRADQQRASVDVARKPHQRQRHYGDEACVNGHQEAHATFANAQVMADRGDQADHEHLIGDVDERRETNRDERHPLHRL